MDYRLLSFEKGRYDEIPTYEVAKDNDYTPAEWQRVLFNRQRMAVGTPNQIKEQLNRLAHELAVDELVISTFTDRLEDRLHSYELMASVVGLSPRAGEPGDIEPDRSFVRKEHSSL